MLRAFTRITDTFRGRGHDLLDFQDASFDRDYIEFNVKVAEVRAPYPRSWCVSFELLCLCAASG